VDRHRRNMTKCLFNYMNDGRERRKICTNNICDDHLNLDMSVYKAIHLASRHAQNTPR